MQNSKFSAVTTETKVTIGILIATLVIIVGGIMMFKGSAGNGADGYAQYIDTDLGLSKEKVSGIGRPTVTGTGTSTSATTTPIEITEFLDYECPACASVGEPLIKQLLATYGNRLTVTRRIYPLHGQPSIEVARLVLAAQSVSQEAYEKLHTKIFETQATWAPMGKDARATFFKTITTELGLNYDQLVAVGATPKYAGQIEEDRAAAIELGIRATPSFIINNTTRITGGLPLTTIQEYVEKY